INYMMIDMMAAIARKDYQQRRLRQAQGIEKAKASGVYKGRPVDAELRNRVRELLAAGSSEARCVFNYDRHEGPRRAGATLVG
ncbi:putative resolvase, partial [Pseudomonas syringae pv. actinidiae ICMP 19104]